MPTFNGDTVIKEGDAGSDELLCEAAGLRWLAEAEADGGIHIARVHEASRTRLVEERIDTAAPSRAAALRIGAELARTHAAGAPWWGCPPPEAPEGARGIGRALTPWTGREDAPSTWGAFFAEYRIMYYVRLLRDEGAFGPRETQLLERVAARVADGVFDAPQPQLVRTSKAPCARLHGDLWAGNVLYAAPRTGHPGALIDPMAYGGHAETDLAMLQLFGFPYLDDVLAGYCETSPLADGWRERTGLHQLAPPRNQAPGSPKAPTRNRALPGPGGPDPRAHIPPRSGFDPTGARADSVPRTARA